MQRLAKYVITPIMAIALAVMLVPLVSNTLEARAATQYPTADELIVAGQPMSAYTGNRASYDASTGTLTLTGSVSGVSVQSSRSNLDLCIVADGQLTVSAQSRNEWNRPRLIAILNETGGNLTIQVTPNSRLYATASINDDAPPATIPGGITEVAGISCTGTVTITGGKGSTADISARAQWYETKDGKTTVKGQGNLLTSGIRANGGLTIEGDVTGNVNVYNSGAITAGSSYCSAAVRVAAGAKVNLNATKKWHFNTASCSGLSANFYTSSGSLTPAVHSDAGEVVFSIGSSEKSHLVLNGSGSSAAMKDLPEVDKHELYVAPSYCQYTPSSRNLIKSTTIELTEVPALGTPAPITADNCILDSEDGVSPRYKISTGSSFWWFQRAEDVLTDNWHTVSGIAAIPANAVRVRVSFHISANEGYRFAYSTKVYVKLAGGQTRGPAQEAYVDPASKPSSGKFYIDIPLSDLSEQHAIDSVKVSNVRAPRNGEYAWVNTEKAAWGSGYLPSDSSTHYEWAKNQYADAGYLGFQYWTVVNADKSDGAVVADGTPWQPGRTYRWHGILHAKAGYKFTYSTHRTINDWTGAPKFVSADGKLMEITRDWTTPTLRITAVAVDDQTEPVAGATPVIDGTVPDEAAYSVNAQDSYWVKGRLDASSYWTDANTPFTGTFEADEWYTLVTFVDPDRTNGYGFGNSSSTYSNDADLTWDKTDATINGAGYDYGRYYAKGQTAGRGQLMLMRTFYCTNPDAISRIDIQQTMPQAGQTAKGDAVSLTSGVTVGAIDSETLEWLAGLGVDTSQVPANATSLWMGALFTEDEEINANALMPTFENSAAGISRTYMLTVQVKAEEEAVFAKGNDGQAAVDAFVGGIPASVAVGEDGTDATLTLHYVMPWAGDDSYQLFIPDGVSLERELDDGSYTEWSPVETDYNYTGYSLYNPDAGMNFRIRAGYWPSTWKAPSGQEFYKWHSPSDGITFGNGARDRNNYFTMPAHDTAIGILTQAEGTLPTELGYWMHDGYTNSENWENADHDWSSFDGQSQWREAVLVDDKGTSETEDDYTLVKGVDYAVSYEPAAGADAGEYTVTYTGIPGPHNVGGYEGSFTTKYSIDSVNIADCDITLDTTHVDEPASPGDDPVHWEYYDDGKEIKPSVTITLGDYTLIEGKNYELTYDWNTEPGDARIGIDCTESGNFAGWDSRYFEIRARDMSEATVTPPADVAYDGTFQTPEASVTYKGATLKEGTDFYVSYKDNRDAGEAKLVIEGNRYEGWTGTVEVTFTIKPMDLSNPDIEWIENLGPRTYTGEAIEPFSYVGNYGGYHPTAGDLYKGTAFEVTGYANNVNPGAATVTLTGKGDYTGTHELTFRITDDIENANGVDALDGKEIHWDGTGAMPKLELTHHGVTLAEGTDYMVRCEGFDSLGNASYVVDGKGYYTGSAGWYDCTIVATQLSDCVLTEPGTQAYTGLAIEPGVKLVYNGHTLVEGTDYTIEYSNNVEAGTAGYTVRGLGGFTGELEGTFEIAAFRFADVAESSWYHDIVYEAVGMGLITGYETNPPTFKPNANITRGQVVTILWRAAGQPAAPSAGFKDVKSDTYYTAAVDWAYAEGVTTGYVSGSSKTFKPNNNITRQELATMLYRYVKARGGDVGASAAWQSKRNASKVASWAKEAIAWAVAHDIIGSDGDINPVGNAKRCEATKMILMSVKLIP